MVETLAKKKKNESTGFGARLRSLRLAAKMTQQDLAELVDMLPTNIARLEAGTRDPSWRTVMAIAKALNVSVAEFVPEDDSE